MHRVNSYRTLPRAGDPAAAAVDGLCHAVDEAGLQDVTNARYYGGTSSSAISWCGRFGVPTSSLAGCSCHGDQTVLSQCDGGCDLCNGGDDVDGERDVVDYGVCASSKPAAGGRGDHASQHDVAGRCLLGRPQTRETTELLGDLNDNVTSSRDFLVASDTAIGQRVGNHDNNNADDVYDDGDDE